MKNRKKGSAVKKIVVLVLCVVLLLPVVSRAKVVWELETRKKALEAQKAQLLEENKRLNEEYQRATSLENIERIAREKLGMVKEGEKPLVFYR
ncbi:Septum formation initiator [Thermosyntropha lipolytica DSM 11003]|uniref:Septum formation initiator n=1 Tax=Thermosyntropha lipolytica DSM 11003 TaxID=1123382 RepID=A0A1M5JTK2_9FIRM|nr:septum formation initiator family protein [Thermosyntropha lipolytica]SHG43745.1 Septum formation initiator [Thermosyntropha lipolytica DSM 11003]